MFIAGFAKRLENNRCIVPGCKFKTFYYICSSHRNYLAPRDVVLLKNKNKVPSKKYLHNKMLYLGLLEGNKVVARFLSKQVFGDPTVFYEEVPKHIQRVKV